MLDNFLLLRRQGSQLFVPSGPSTEYEAHLHYGEQLLNSEFTGLNVSLIQNHLPETSRIILDQVSGYYSPAKLTHKINYHICITFSIVSQIQETLKTRLLGLILCLHSFLKVRNHGNVCIRANGLWSLAGWNDIIFILPLFFLSASHTL